MSGELHNGLLRFLVAKEIWPPLQEQLPPSQQQRRTASVAPTQLLVKPHCGVKSFRALQLQAFSPLPVDGRKKKASLISDWTIRHLTFAGRDTVVDIRVERITNLKSDHGAPGVNEAVPG